MKNSAMKQKNIKPGRNHLRVNYKLKMIKILLQSNDNLSTEV